MKTFVGYFTSIYDAQKACSALKKQGYQDATLDIIDRFPKSTDKMVDNVVGGQEGSLSNLVLKPGEGEIPMELRPLYAADPTVSGMGTIDEITDANIQLTVSGKEGDETDIQDVIRKNNGQI